MPQLVAHALLVSIPGRLWLLLLWPTFLRRKKRYDALGYKPPAGSQLTETRYAVIACLVSTRRCESAFVVSSRSMGWVIPKPGKVGFESCRLVHVMWDFWKAWHRGLFLEGTWPELPSYCYAFQRTRRREGEWLHTWHWQHAVDTRASHLLMKVWTWQTPLVRWTEKHRRRDSTKVARD